jgi:hypothetical protein
MANAGRHVRSRTLFITPPVLAAHRRCGHVHAYPILARFDTRESIPAIVSVRRYGGQQNAQVRFDSAHAFWDGVIGYGYRENNLRAMVIDTLQVTPPPHTHTLTICHHLSNDHHSFYTYTTASIIITTTTTTTPATTPTTITTDCEYDGNDHKHATRRCGSKNSTTVSITPIATRRGWTPTSAPATV